MAAVPEVAAVASVVVVAAVAVAAVAVAVAVVAHAHVQYLGRLDHPCALKASAKGPSAPRPGGVLRTLAERAPQRHPQGTPLL